MTILIIRHIKNNKRTLKILLKINFKINTISTADWIMKLIIT
uniref:Uncharacterized protein n=1 Tax=Anguilla anguilla TaxID=7936 RepID=A0A0E9V1P6_ANGAN